MGSPGLFHPTSMGKKNYIFFHPVGAHQVWKEKIHMVTLLKRLKTGRFEAANVTEQISPMTLGIFWVKGMSGIKKS